MKEKIMIIILICFIVCINLASGLETKNITFENHTFEITPIIENFCESTNKVFRIERNPYNSSMESILVSYNFTLEGKNYYFESEEEKTIKKYSESNTGKYEKVEDGEYNISLVKEEQKLTWEIYVNCSLGIFLNETNNTENNTEINESTINISNTNQTETNNTENVSEEIKEDEIVCEFEMYSDKQVYEVGEKAKIYMITDAKIYEIKYKIEDLYGKTVKSEYITTNTNTKSYTFKSIEEKEKGYYIIARIESDCIKKEEKKLVMVKNEIKKEEESRIIITKAEYKEKYVEVNIEAYRGNTSKKTISVYLESLDDEKKITPTTILTLPEKNNQLSAKINLQILGNIPSAGTIKITGLDKKDQKTISLFEPQAPEIIKSYTRSKYLSENITWYVRIKGDGLIKVNFTSNTKSEIKEITIDGEKTIEFLLEKPISEENISVVAEYYGLKATHKSTLELIDKNKEEETAKNKTNSPILESVNQTKSNLLTGRSVASTSSEVENKVIPWLIGGLLIMIGGFLGLRSLKKKTRAASFIKSEYDMNSDETKRNQ